MPKFPHTARIVRVACISLFMVACCAAIGFCKSPSFDEARLSFTRVSGDLNSTREQWLDSIYGLLEVFRTARDPSVKSECLLLAGRGSISLYQRSGRIEDLDLAILCLKNFVWMKPRGRNFAVGLRELSAALALRKEFNNKPAPAVPQASPERAAQPPRQAEQADARAKPWSKAASHARLNAKPSRNDPRICAVPSENNRNRWGNPFCPPGGRMVLGLPIRIERAARPPADPVTPQQAPSVPRAKRGFVVVVDPGHGGKDPGAVSPDGKLKEKDITLDIARRLKAMLEKKYPEITVLLTRNDDRFLTLTERTAIANSVNGDLFLSIHCNANADTSCMGTEIFYLSKACSKRAMEVAARENGISANEVSDLESMPAVSEISGKNPASERLARIVHSFMIKRLGPKKGKGSDRGVRRAPFQVLRGAKMPSILVECAFLSNAADRKKLGNPIYLGLLADAMASGAHEYLQGHDKGTSRSARARRAGN